MNKIYADKIKTISTDLVYSRVKDIYDLYVLSGLEGFRISSINKILPTLRRPLGDFDDFLNGAFKQNGIEDEYKKMVDIVNPPDFKTIYNMVKIFCSPFITGQNRNSDAVWVINRYTGTGEWVKQI